MSAGAHPVCHITESEGGEGDSARLSWRAASRRSADELIRPHEIHIALLVPW